MTELEDLDALLTGATQASSENAHAKLSPSQAKRWMTCPGSVRLSAGLPSKSSPAAADGTACHSLTEDLITGKITEEHLRKLVGTKMKTWDGFTVTVTDEMVAAALLFRSVVEEYRNKLQASRKPAPIHGEAEKRVDATSVDPDLWGTADYIIFQRGNCLVVIDLKFGKKAVDAEENHQMAIYAIGAMDTIAGWGFDEAEFVIVQPRAAVGGKVVRRWKASMAWLRGFQITLKSAVAETKHPKAKLKAGSWCYFCPAKQYGKCPEILKEIQAAAAADFSVLPSDQALGPVSGSAVLPPVDELPLARVVAAYRWKGLLSSWFDGLEERILGELKAGHRVPGYKLVRAKTHRRFKNEAVVVERFELEYGDSIYTKQELLSPAQLEKVVGKDVIEQFTERTEGALDVAEDDDNREEVTFATGDFKMIDVEIVDEKDPLAGLMGYDDPLAGLMTGNDAEDRCSVCHDLNDVDHRTCARVDDPLAGLMGDEKTTACNPEVDIEAELLGLESLEAVQPPKQDKKYKKIWP